MNLLGDFCGLKDLGKMERIIYAIFMHPSIESGFKLGVKFIPS